MSECRDSTPGTKGGDSVTPRRPVPEYSDAISFSLSNRQNAPLIKFTVSADVVAALLNAAIQKAQQAQTLG